jgi:hypothetical protein
MAVRNTATGIQGIDTVMRNLYKELKRIQGKSTTGLTRAAWHVMKESIKIVPVATGFLKNSSYVKPPFIGRRYSYVEFGYHAAYALYVHENPRSGKTGGFSPSGHRYPDGKWARVGEYKFLEKPLRNNQRKIVQIIRNYASK